VQAKMSPQGGIFVSIQLFTKYYKVLLTSENII